MSVLNSKPWYVYGWVWVLFLIPFSAVMFGIVMIATVQIFPDDTVSDNYYKEGMAINKKFIQDESSPFYGVQVGVYTLENQKTEFDSIPPAVGAVHLNLRHIADSAKDLVIVLSRDSMGSYFSEDSQLYDNLSRPGVWYLEFHGTAEDWRAYKRLVTPLNSPKGEKN